MACEFPVAVKSWSDAKLLYTVYFTLLYCVTGQTPLLVAQLIAVMDKAQTENFWVSKEHVTQNMVIGLSVSLVCCPCNVQTLRLSILMRSQSSLTSLHTITTSPRWRRSPCRAAESARFDSSLVVESVLSSVVDWTGPAKRCTLMWTHLRLWDPKQRKKIVVFCCWGPPNSPCQN